MSYVADRESSCHLNICLL